MNVQRTRSDPSLRHREKDIDLNLAYGNIPPDLESRVDLDPEHQAAQKEQRARNLVGHVEGLLDEAHCVHHTATSIIAHLQSNPEAAAAVALTLAELSTLLTKMSPAFLGIIKGGSPAVFALLASPQFLIGAGVAVGVTVVMFGGWKIIKRIREANAAKQEAAAMAFASQQGPPMPMPARPASDGFDEALIIEDELSTIETWRRGILPFGEGESADLELISPEAERAMRQHRRHSSGDQDQDRDADTSSRSGRTERSARTHRSSKSHRSHKSRKDDIPERKSSKGAGTTKDGESVASSHRTSKSKRGTIVEMKAIEDGSRVEGENSIDAVLRPKEKKGNMLKTLFKKKKEKEEREKVSVIAS
jgi:hypothetical protein